MSSCSREGIALDAEPDRRVVRVTRNCFIDIGIAPRTSPRFSRERMWIALGTVGFTSGKVVVLGKSGVSGWEWVLWSSG